MGMKYHLKQQITELVAKSIEIFPGDRVGDFVRLFDRVRSDRLERLRAVPRAIAPKSRHQAIQAFHLHLLRLASFASTRAGTFRAASGERVGTVRANHPWSRRPYTRARTPRAIALVFLACALLATVGRDARAAPSNPPISAETISRIIFLEARSAIRRGKRGRFNRLSESLGDHPLSPWLRYHDFRRNFGRHSESAIEKYLASVSEAPMADIVRVLWLDRLARQHRWARFLDVFEKVSPAVLETRHKCYRARAFFETGADLAGFKSTAKLWQVPRSQDKACDRTFALWKKRGGQTPEQLWRRIEISLKRGNRRLAGYVARMLPRPDRVVAERWIRDHRHPSRIVARAGRIEREPTWRLPVNTAIASLARRTPEAAARAWRKATASSSSVPVDVDAFAAWRIGLGFAQEHRIHEAVEWIERVPEAFRSPRLLGVLALLSFAEGRWADSLAALEALPPGERANLRWQYWRARALTALGRSAEAPWSELAAERDYYGFLAADRIEAPYRIVQNPAGSSAESLSRVERMAGFRRAMEFHALGFRNRFNREWSHLTARLEGPDLAAAAELATRRGWYFEAIRAAARAGALDRLDLRFPIAWKDEAEDSAHAHDIDPALILATIRMESAFRPRARSSAGALGLMQVMPATGRRIARAAGVKVSGRQTLLDPEKNIRLGAAYLRRVLDRMHGHAALASAAYKRGSPPGETLALRGEQHGAGALGGVRAVYGNPSIREADPRVSNRLPATPGKRSGPTEQPPATVTCGGGRLPLARSVSARIARSRGVTRPSFRSGSRQRAPGCDAGRTDRPFVHGSHPITRTRWRGGRRGQPW